MRGCMLPFTVADTHRHTDTQSHRHADTQTHIYTDTHHRRHWTACDATWTACDATWQPRCRRQTAIPDCQVPLKIPIPS
jgi:hypothetical protein